MEFPGTFKLNTGAEIPAIGLGTLESTNEVASEVVFEAIKAGYRHIDTAAIYDNEEGIGDGIRKAILELGVNRADLFITTKLWLTDFHEVSKGLETSLNKLFPNDKQAYVDLYLMHWPFAIEKGTRIWDQSITFNEVYAELEKLPESKVRAIGVSNFTINNLKKLLSTAVKTPAVNQVELHVNLPQTKLVDFLLKGDYGYPAHNGKIILPEAFSPLGRGNLNDPVIERIAKSYNTTPASIVINWGISRQTVVLPKSANPQRIRLNLEYIRLTDEDLTILNELSKGKTPHRYFDFLESGFNPFNDNEDSH